MIGTEEVMALEIRLLEDMGRRYGAYLERSRERRRRRIRAAQEGPPGEEGDPCAE